MDSAGTARLSFKCLYSCSLAVCPCNLTVTKMPGISGIIAMALTSVVSCVVMSCEPWSGVGCGWNEMGEEFSRRKIEKSRRGANGAGFGLNFNEEGTTGTRSQYQGADPSGRLLTAILSIHSFQLVSFPTASRDQPLLTSIQINMLRWRLGVTRHFQNLHITVVLQIVSRHWLSMSPSGVCGRLHCE